MAPENSKDMRDPVRMSLAVPMSWRRQVRASVDGEMALSGNCWRRIAAAILVLADIVGACFYGLRTVVIDPHRVIQGLTW